MALPQAKSPTTASPTIIDRVILYPVSQVTASLRRYGSSQVQVQSKTPDSSGQDRHYRLVDNQAGDHSRRPNNQEGETFMLSAVLIRILDQKQLVARGRGWPGTATSPKR
mgnify:CR=1 FL=1